MVRETTDDLFADWQTWGGGLDVTQFANAMACLGVLLGDSFYVATADQVDTGAPPAEAELEALLGAMLAASQNWQRHRHGLIAWAFPRADAVLRLADPEASAASARRRAPWPCFQVRDLPAFVFATAWQRATCFEESPPRLVCRDLPTPSDGAWLRCLKEAVPVIRAAHIGARFAKADLRFRWPARIGTLPGSPAALVASLLQNMWPSSELTHALELDRDQACCDLLLFDGTGADLEHALTATPINTKTNFVVLRGDGYADMTVMEQAVRRCRASGFVAIDMTVSDQDLADLINRLIEEFSHNLPFDVALANALTAHGGIAVVAEPHVVLGAALASLSMEDIVEGLLAELEGLPPDATLPVPNGGFSDEVLPQIAAPAPALDDVLTDGGDEDEFDLLGDDDESGSGGLADTGEIERPPQGDDESGTITAGEMAQRLREHRGNIPYHSESAGASGLSGLARALADVQLSEDATRRRQQRFLQQRCLVEREGVYAEEKEAFQAGEKIAVDVYIGPPDKKGTALPTPFPEHQLPKQTRSWRLMIVLSEANHLKNAIVRPLALPQEGVTGTARFEIELGRHAQFEARISVVHRGRTLQTGVLRARVLGADAAPPNDGERIRFEEWHPVGGRLTELENRRQFDASIVVNDSAEGRPLLTGVADQHAWISSIEDSRAVSAKLNDLLSQVAHSAADYGDGLDSEDCLALMVKLANLGVHLHRTLVRRQIDTRGNAPEIADKEYIQIVTTRSEALVPFEFIYEYAAPTDDAKLCQNWRAALETGKCPGDCDHADRSRICPMGFWGISKVIERHAYTPDLARDGRELFLQSEPGRGRATLRLDGASILARSERVDAASFDMVVAAMKARSGRTPHTAASWDEWRDLVISKKPGVLWALPHTDGVDFEVTLEIGGTELDSNGIGPDYVRASDASQFPLVALLGCDTQGTAQSYGSHVAIFRDEGAAVVIGTIATVFGQHAAEVSRHLIEGLRARDGRSERLGEILREVKRKALLASLPMALCIVAFGDADWRLE